MFLVLIYLGYLYVIFSLKFPNDMLVLLVCNHKIFPLISDMNTPALTLLHTEWPKLNRVLAVLSAIGLNVSSYGPFECNRVK